MICRSLVLSCAVALGLGACARHDAPATTTAPSTAAAAVVVRGRIDVEGGALALTLPLEGRIAEVPVAEGDHVRKGQPLLTADPAAARIDADLARARLSFAEGQVALADARAASARTRATRLAQALKADAADGQSADDAHDLALQSGAEAQSARASVSVAHAELARADYQASQLQLRAPVDGDVVRVSAWPGLHVAPQGPALVTLLPSRARIVRAEIAEDLLGSVSVGMQAEIVSDDGRGTVIGTARVLRIGSTFGASQLQDDPDQRISERSVSGVLAFDRPSSLRVGQRVLVRFAPALR